MIRFRALGTPELWSPDGIELQSILARPKLLGLLSFLASARPHGFHRRDTLLGLLWAEVDQQRGRRALRQSLYYLRQSLGDGVVLGRGDEEVALDEERFWCDVGGFERALEEDQPEEALELYRGELLAGLYVSGAPEYERWLAERREDLRRQACTAAWQLAERTGSEGNAAAAGHWAHRAMLLAPLDEGLATQAIALLDRLGDRSGAVRLYEAFARRLDEELDLKPSPETNALVEEIRSRTEVAEERVVSPSGPAVAKERSDAVEPPLAAATAVRDAAPAEPAMDASRARPGLRGKGFRLGFLAGIGAMIVLGLVWAFQPREEAILDPRRVVVAVFENQTGESDLDPLGRMAADWITQGLAESGLVDVVPSTFGLASRPDFTDRALPTTGATASLAETTEAGTIVAGVYYRRGDSVEFQAQIIDARNGRLLSAVAPVGGALADPGSAVDSLRRTVVRTLAVLVEPSLAASEAATHPPSLEAYREYLEGVRAFERRNAMGEALTYFYRALELDSTFIAPRFYIVFAHGNLGEHALADSNAQLLNTRRPLLTEYQRNTLDWQLARLHGDEMAALEATRARGGIDVGVQALRVNRPQEAVNALAHVGDLTDWYFHWLALTEAYHGLGDYTREFGEVQRGREVYRERLRPLMSEIRALAGLGRIDQVYRALDVSLELPEEEGLTPATVMLEAAAELRAHGFRAVSIEIADRAIEWLLSHPRDEPAAPAGRFDLALANYQAERWEEARGIFEELAAELPNDVNVLGFLGVLAARRGDRDEALRISEGLTGLAAPRDFGRDLYWQACIAAQLGESERAMALLREAYASGRVFSILLHRDMDLEPLHDYAPFQQFVRPKG